MKRKRWPRAYPFKTLDGLPLEHVRIYFAPIIELWIIEGVGVIEFQDVCGEPVTVTMDQET